VSEAADVIEQLHARGVTDGLPVVPPTRALVEAMITASGHRGDELIACVAPANGRATVEKIAINAVMAGCRPDYMPVVVAAVRAMCDDAFDLVGLSGTTDAVAPIFIVNGPVRAAIQLNCAAGALGPGARANATIGRALRLLIINVLGGVPGQLDRSTLGHPGKFTYCIAEDEEDSPWPSLASERGVALDASAVTVMGSCAPHQLMNEWTHEPREILDTYIAAIRANMLVYSIWPGNYFLVVPKQHRQIFAAAGWSKKDIREYVAERAHVRRGEWRSVGKGAVAGRTDEARVYTAVRTPDDLLVVAAGGPAGGFGAVVPPWYGTKGVAVTARVGA